MVALISVHSLFSVRVSNIQKVVWFWWLKTVKKSSVLPQYLLRGRCGDGQRHGYRNVWTAYATSHRWILEIGAADVVFEMKIQDELIFVACSQPEMVQRKNGCSEPANNNNASREDYLGVVGDNANLGRKRGVIPSHWTNSEWVASFSSPCRQRFPRKSLPDGGLKGLTGLKAIDNLRYTFVILVSMFKLLLHGLGTISWFVSSVCCLLLLGNIFRLLCSVGMPCALPLDSVKVQTCQSTSSFFFSLAGI